MRNKIIRWLPVLLWAGLIFALSSMPSLPSAQRFAWDYLFKKSAHVTVYAVLFWLAARALEKPTPKKLLVVLVGCILYGISDEFHQSFVMGRTARIYDVGFDAFGASIAYLRRREIL